MNKPLSNKAVLRAKTALAKKRRILLVSLIVAVLLGVGLGLTLFFTSRTAFYDPVDGTKYFVAKEDGLYVLKTKGGDVITAKTSEGNYITAAGTLVYVDEETGEHSTVAAVLVEEEGEAVRFDSYTAGYDVLLYPYAERTDMAAITVVNSNGSFGFIAVDSTDATTGNIARSFIIEERPDLSVDQSILFANLVTFIGKTRTLLRLDTNRVKELGYAEYGLPENVADATCYFEVVVDKSATDDIPAVTHKVILGKQIPSGDGYFVRYAGREAVYVLQEIGASDYSRSVKEFLLGTLENYVTAPNASTKMEANNYFDVTNFMIYEGNNTSPKIHFSYSGSIDSRQNTYYSNIPYKTQGGLSGYTINDYRADDALYALYTWAPDFVVKVGTSANMGENLDDWLKPYGLNTGAYAHRISFTFNAVRTYNESTGEDVIKKENQEYHEILVSHKQEDGYYYVYNICMLYDRETGEFSTAADGYNMIVAIDGEQLDFLSFTTKDWTSSDIFSGHIAYMTELSVKIAPGFVSKYPAGYEETFTLDNSETLQYLAENPGASKNISTDKLIVRDSHGKTLNALQFKTFYSSLLYTTVSGYSSLTDAQKAAHIASGEAGAALMIEIRYELRELNTETGYYELTGEEFTRTYCFYENLAYPRQFYTTVNGVGDFFTVSSRVKKVMNDIMKLYGTPETDPISYDTLN